MKLPILFSLVFVCSITTVFSQNWEQLNDTPFMKHHSNGFGFEGKAYIIEGTQSEAVSNEVWQYDPADDTWTRLNDFPGPGRAIAIGDDMDGKYYYGFGGGIDGLLSDLWEYDPLTDSFVELPECPCQGRSHPALVAHNNKIFMGSGSGEQSDLNDWWVLDLETMEWSQKENIPGPRRHHPFQFGIDDGIYVGGGHVSSWSRFDVMTEEWTPIDNLPAGRVAGAQFSYNGKGYVLSGDDADHGPLGEHEYFMEYDSELDLWTSLPPHPQTNRWAPSSFIIDDALYLFGGYPYYDDFVRDSSMYKFDLTQLGCLAPRSLNSVNVTDTEAGLFWVSNSNSETDTLYWRAVGQEVWNKVEDANAVYSISELEACRDYEFRVVSQCADQVSLSSETYLFTTDGCCTSPTLTTASISEGIEVQWNGILAADSYRIRWRTEGSNNWNEEETQNAQFELLQTVECTNYEFQIKPVCLIEDVPFSESYYHLTSGCGVCLDNTYCSVEYDDSDWLYIDRVVINDFENTTGNDEGNGDYAEPGGIAVTLGEIVDIEITLGSSDAFIFGAIAAWVDFDGNGEFAQQERVIFDEFNDGSLAGSFEIPNSAAIGLTRLRIMCTWDEDFDACSPTDWGVGEIEDYCVTIAGSSNLNQTVKNTDIRIYPNPTTGKISILTDHFDLQGNSVTFYDILGNQVLNQRVDSASGALSLDLLNMGFNTGIYLCVITDDERNILHKEKIIFDF